MKKFISTVLFPYFFMICDVNAVQPNISIDSFKVVSVSKHSVEVKISGINKSGSSICISGTAKSSDGVIESQINIPMTVEVIEKSGEFNTLIPVYRPSGTEPKETSKLIFIARSCIYHLKEIIVSKQFDWPIYWNALAEAPARIPETPFQIFHGKIVSAEFKTLDTLLDKWNTTRERDIDGAWKLSSFVYALESSCSYENTKWEQCFKRIETWKKISPKTAGLAEAKYWSDYAWNVRGGRYATNIDPYAMKLFSARMRKAESALKEVDSIKSSNPIWYELYLGIAIDTERDSRFIKKLFDESLKKHSGYLPLYSLMGNHWVNPRKSRENWKELDNLINTATAYTFETDGDSNYATLYSELAYRLKHSESIFQSSFVSWPKMKKSYDTIISKYPSATNLNEYTFLACQANDKNTFLTLRPKLEKKIKPESWPHNYSLDLCEQRFLQRI